MNGKNVKRKRRQTWAQVYLDFYPQLLAYAHRLTHDAVQSQDLVQETILRCIRHTQTPEEIKAPLIYLVRSMRCAWIDHWRKYNKYKEISLDDLLSSESIETKYLLVESDVLRRLENEELMETLKANLGPLTAYENQLLDLRLRAYTAEEIAQKLSEDVRVTRYDLNALMAKIRYRLKHRNKWRPLESLP